MTHQPAVPPVSPPPPPGFSPSVKAPLSVFALVALIVAAVLSVLHLVVRLLDAALGSSAEIYKSPLPLVLGILGLASLVVIAVIIALGHVGIAQTRPGRKRGRTIAVIATTIGYVLLVLYLNRIIVAIIATVTQKDGQFTQDIFWWA